MTLFAVHPLQVESVAWAMGRKEILSGALTLASLLVYTYWQRRRCYGMLTAAAVLFALAMLAAVSGLDLSNGDLRLHDKLRVRKHHTF